MTLPDLEPVKSSNIDALGHDGTHLFVRFHNGAVWRYADVSPAIFIEMKNSGSVGRYLAEFIKKNHKGERVS